MKTRTQFVANSSSTSFVIALPSKPGKAISTQDMLFGNKQMVRYDGDSVSTSIAASIIYNDLKDKEQTTVEDIADTLVERYCVYDGDWYLNRYGYAAPYFGTDVQGTKCALKTLIEIDRQIKVLDEKQQVLLSIAYNSSKNLKTRAKIMGQLCETAEYKALTNQIFELYDQQSPYFTMRNHGFIYDLAMSDAQKFIDDNPNTFITILEYCDNNGDVGCVLEHGDTFDNVNHIRVSHH